MSNIEGIAQKIIKQMQEQGRVKTLSKEQTYSIDNELAEGLKPIKEEFYKKTSCFKILHKRTRKNNCSNIKMSTLINRTEEINSIIKPKIMDSPEEIKMIEKIDELNKKISDEYRVKEINSWINSGKCYVFNNFN